MIEAEVRFWILYLLAEVGDVPIQLLVIPLAINDYSGRSVDCRIGTWI